MFSTAETRSMSKKKYCDHQRTDKPWRHTNHFKSSSEFSFQILFRIHRNPQADLRNHKNFDKISGQASSSHSQYKIYFLSTCFPISGIGKYVFWDVKVFSHLGRTYENLDKCQDRRPPPTPSAKYDVKGHQNIYESMSHNHPGENKNLFIINRESEN